MNHGLNRNIGQNKEVNLTTLMAKQPRIFEHCSKHRKDDCWELDPEKRPKNNRRGNGSYQNKIGFSTKINKPKVVKDRIFINKKRWKQYDCYSVTYLDSVRAYHSKIGKNYLTKTVVPINKNQYKSADGTSLKLEYKGKKNH